MHNKLSFEPIYHELWVRATEPYWSAIEDPCIPEVQEERKRIEAEGATVNWDAQLQLNKFRMVSSIPYCLAVIGIVAEAVRRAADWPLMWQVLTGAVVLPLVLGLVLFGARRVSREFPRQG